MNNEFKMAIALLQFKKAYKNLTDISKTLPDLDVSDSYPFYLLDFEAIQPQVAMWCDIHAARLLKEVPDKVDNPVCTSCEYFRIGLGPDGLCKAANDKKCGTYPLIVFTKEQVIPFLISIGKEVNSETTDAEVYIMYTSVLEVLYDEHRKKKESEILEESQLCMDLNAGSHSYSATGCTG